MTRNIAQSLSGILVLLVCFLAGAAWAQGMTKQDLVREAKAAITEVTVEQALAMHERGGAYFIDCREQNEFRTGHVPGALHVPRGWLEFRIADLVPEKEAVIVVYCRTGDRSSLAVQSLQRMGYANAVNLKGGWRAWDEAGYPVQ